MQINNSTTPAEKTTLEYFTSSRHVDPEDTYGGAVDYLTEAIAARTAPAAANVSHAGDVSFIEQHHGMSTPLPRIPMPTFTGLYTDWISFRDFFESLVLKNESISNVQKLHYLKVSIERDASSLLKCNDYRSELSSGVERVKKALRSITTYCRCATSETVRYSSRN